MSSFVINGGKSLRGEVNVSGSKNAALPLIFACIAVSGVSTLVNVPNIGDVDVALSLLRDFGAKIERRGSTLEIDTASLTYKEPREELVKKIRASTYLLGACVARFGKAKISDFGGCNFEARPIDMHLKAISALGGTVRGDVITANSIVGTDIYFDKQSVGATINALIAASAAKGRTRIFGYAKEPHVLSLLSFLSSAGLKIKKSPTCVELWGGKLNRAYATVIPDMIECGTYVIASLLTDSSILIKGADVSHLSSFFGVLENAGVKFEVSDKGIIPRGKIKKPICLTTAPHPGFPTDLQPQMAPLAAAFCGGSLTEGVWRGRFGYLTELEKFGIKHERRGDTAYISPSSFVSACVESTDLRGGAASLLSAIYTSGTSEISSVEIIKRGYENIVEKLTLLGVDIRERNT